jgi:putative oxidoreductase
VSASTTTLTNVRADALAAEWAPRVLSVLRIVVALLFLQHGMQKLFGFPAPAANGLPAVLTLAWFAGIIEFGGSLLLLLGLFTRPAAFIMSGEMAVAYWMAHAPRNAFPLLNGGEGAILFCFVFLYLAVTGGGPWALDRALRRN